MNLDISEKEIICLKAKVNFKAYL